MSKLVQQIPPAKALINGIRAIGYSFSTSVADIIDNSIAAKAKNINIFSDPLADNPYFCILDDGYGMNYDELKNAMVFGSDRSKKEGDILDLGRFGLGLKSASLSQSRELIVVSKNQSNIHCMSYDLDIIEKNNDWNLLIYDEKEIEQLPRIDELKKIDSGTLVIWRKFDKIESTTKNFDETFREIVAESKKHVELVFHRFYNEIKIYFNHDRIERRDPFLTESIPRTQKGRTDSISMDNEIILITPYILPYQNSLTINEKKLLGNPKSIYDDQGFYIYRNKRLIMWGSWLRMSVRNELTKLARIQVDIPSKLDSQWSMDVKKSTAKIPDKIKDLIRASVEESIIKSKNVNQYRGVKELTPENKMWNRIIERDGYVRYEINRENPVLRLLFDTIDDKEYDLLNTIISQIEDYLPKYTIHNDASDINIIIANNDDNKEEKLINEVIQFSKLFPINEREQKIKEILTAEGYKKIVSKLDEILKEAINNE